MEREIKFRAKQRHWDEFDSFNTWLFASGYYYDGTNYWFTLPDDENSGIAYAQHKIIDINTLGQYTGLKDKNGKEIYEGDIVELLKRRTLTNLFTRQLTIHIQWSEDGLNWNIWRPHPDLEKWEVIGNIYENPELVSPTPNGEGE